MKLPVYKKEINKFAFKQCHDWDFHKGYYSEGEHQYMVTFEPVENISTFRNHYYRFHKYNDQGLYVFWLKLGWFQNVRFQCMQHGVLKTILSPIVNIGNNVISLFK